MLELSIVICAHNPRQDYLIQVLKSLRSQTLPMQHWELLLVDNASKEPLEKSWDVSWHPNARHVFESKLGIAYARQRGMREASANVLVFVDDDNVLELNYLSEVLNISRAWPQLGVWGSGDTRPEFESDPPDTLREYISYLALRNTKNPCWSNVFTCQEANPWGAGICVRANVAAAYCEYWNSSPLRISGRSGATLISGEDKEICFVACNNLGLGMGIFPELKLTHLIPKQRITEDYLVRLREGIALSDNLLAYKWQGKLPRNYLSFLGLMRVLKNLLARRGIHRRMYLASVRAAIAARRLISANKPKD